MSRSLGASGESLWQSNCGLLLPGYRDVGVYSRVRVKNASGTWIDLSGRTVGQAGDIDWLAGWRVGELHDQPCATATIRLWRDQYSWSLVPGAVSPLNVDDSGAEAPLLAPRREVLIETQFARPGYACVSAGTWWTQFKGRIDKLGGGTDSDTITLECSDDGAQLRDEAFVEQEEPFGATGAGTALETLCQDLIDHWVANSLTTGQTASAWQGGTTYATGSLCVPTTRNARGYAYKVTGGGGGSSGAGEPTWPTTLGSTVADGALTWTCADYLPTVQCPVSPAWNVYRYIQSRGPLLSALREVVAQRGWDIRYEWNNTRQQFELLLQEPVRTFGASSLSFDRDTADAVRFSQDMAAVRNRINVIYTDPDGQGVRESEITEDATSRASYGTRYGELAEASTSAVDTQAEAQALGAAAIADLAYPYTEYEIECAYAPAAQLWDVVALSRDIPILGTDTYASIVGFTHECAGSNQAPHTTLQTRETGGQGSRLSLLRRMVGPGTASATPQAGSAVLSYFRAYRDAAFTVAQADGYKQLPLDTETADVGGCHDASTGLFTAPTTGDYLVEAQVTLSAVPNGADLVACLYKTPVGGAAAYLCSSPWETGTGADMTVTVSRNVHLLAGESISLYVAVTNTGDTVNLATGNAITFWSGRRLR